MASKELPPSENIADVEKVVEAVVDIKEDGVNTEKDQYKGESDQKVTFRHYLVTCPCYYNTSIVTDTSSVSLPMERSWISSSW